MVRKRAIHSDHVPPANPLLNGSNKTKKKSEKSKWFSLGVGGLLYSLLMFGVVCGLLVVGLWQYRHSQEEAVVTKSNLPLASSNPPFDEVTWGTYRSQLYFGLRNRHPDSPLFGLIWYKQPTEQIVRSLSLRHWCEQGDNVQFMWEDSDGRSFGHQVIGDGALKFDTDWFNYGENSWSARIRIDPKSNVSHALVFYFALQDAHSQIKSINKMEGDNYKVLTLNSPVFGNSDLTLQIHDKSGEPPLVTHTSLPIQTQENYVDGTQINNIILSSLGRQENGDLILVNQDSSDLATFVAVQINVKKPMDIEISFSALENSQPQFEDEYEKRLSAFRSKFKQVFPIEAKKDSDFLEVMGRSALSNMLGSIGYWHGYSLVRSLKFSNPQPKQFGPLSLLSAVPSRPFFPRGFVWDEGFHNLLIRQFDPLLSIDIISSWLDTMNIAGWIPREMILGREAQAKVPAEFLVQSDAIANPPMFFYVIQKFMNDPEFMVKHGGRLRQLYPRLKQWYIWIRSTQIGPLPGTFQWQGRNATTDLELNPKVLPSGLDDFPRASHPTDQEYHLDLRCWMAMASKILRRLSENCEDMGWIAEVEEDVRLFNDLDLLDQLHWSETKQQYCDYGLHSENVRLVAVQKSPQKISYVRKVLKPPKLGLVENVNGYINLFPVLLKLLPVDSPKLAAILKNLKNKEELWTPFGLRSLSFKSPYYNARNTEHDPPYWRGAIWINMNYLALDALNYYSQQSGPVKQIATELYASLKKNIVANIAVQYNKTGFFWENYNDVTGEGQGTRPFTGWTALVVNIMADDYD